MIVRYKVPRRLTPYSVKCDLETWREVSDATNKVISARERVRVARSEYNIEKAWVRMEIYTTK